MADYTPQQSFDLVEVKDLGVHFHLSEGTVRAVNGVDFKIRRGRTLGVVGESGCGKSVTARALLRIESPGKIISGEIFFNPQVQRGNSGTVELLSLDPKGSKIREIRGKEIGMIFQEPMTSFGPMHTIGNQIMEAILLHKTKDKKEARALALHALESVGMSRPNMVLDQFPHHLSGGMRQRAMIAMALSCGPSLLIADEPTTALDVTTEAQIIDLLKERQESLGLSMMYITHNLGVIAQIAQDVIVMYLGKVVEQASVDDLFYDARHPYTEALMKSIPRVDQDPTGLLASIEGMIPDPYTYPSGCPFHPRCSKAILGLCDVVEPVISEVCPNHFVSCHLFSQGKTP